MKGASVATRYYLPPGEKLLVCFRPFIQHLASSSRSPKTIRNDVDNLWMLGGEIARALHEGASPRKAAVDRRLRDVIHEDGGPLIHNGSEQERRSFDSTCRKLHRFLSSPALSPPVTHKFPGRANNIKEALEHAAGHARSFGLKPKSILREARQLWRDRWAGKAGKFRAEVERFEAELTTDLRPRIPMDEDNQRLLDGIGLQHDRGRVPRFPRDPSIEPTYNRAERALRGAEAFAGCSSVIPTAAKDRAARSSTLYRNCSSPKARKLLPKPAHHGARRTGASN
jgi:hypothetical protein